MLVGEESDASDAEPGTSNDERAVPERGDRGREPPKKSGYLCTLYPSVTVYIPVPVRIGSGHAIHHRESQKCRGQFRISQ